MRGMEEGSLDGQPRGMLKFSSDARSAKFHDFAASAARDGKATAELCWFFPVTREQYRLRCRVQVIPSEGVELPSLAAAAAASTSAAVAASSSAATPAAASVDLLVRRSAEDLSAHAAFWTAHSSESRGMFEIAPPGTHKKRQMQGVTRTACCERGTRGAGEPGGSAEAGVHQTRTVVWTGGSA
jgi:hypothetical protein